jgi:hypothetical protein
MTARQAELLARNPSLRQYVSSALSDAEVRTLLPTLGVATTTWFATLVTGMVWDSPGRTRKTIRIALETFLANEKLHAPECIEALLQVFMAPHVADAENVKMLLEMWKRVARPNDSGRRFPELPRDLYEVPHIFSTYILLLFSAYPYGASRYH